MTETNIPDFAALLNCISCDKDLNTLERKNNSIICSGCAEKAITESTTSIHSDSGIINLNYFNEEKNRVMIKRNHDYEKYFKNKFA